MRVGVGHSRNDGLARGVDDARVRAAQQHRFAHRADELHASVAHGQRADEWMRVVDRIDARVGDDEVGGRRRRALGAEGVGRERARGDDRRGDGPVGD